MTRKEEMLRDIYLTHDKYKLLFHLIKVSDESFYNWVTKFKTFSEIKKINTYIHGSSEKTRLFTQKCLLRPLLIAQSVYGRLEPKEWIMLCGMSGNEHPQVSDLNLIKRELKSCWINRPKPARRGTT